MNPRVLAGYVISTAIWSTTWLAIKYALLGFAPLTGAGVRFIVAGVFLYAIAAFVRPRDVEKPPLAVVLVLAATLFGGTYALTYTAETHLPSGLVAVVFALMPFFIFGLGALMLDVKVGLRSIVGAAVALAGVAVMSITGQGGDVIYVLAVLGAALISGFANVYLKIHAHNDPWRTLPPAMLIGGIGLTVLGEIFTPIDLKVALQPAPLLATLYLAIFGSCIAFVLYHRLLQHLDAWVVGLQNLIIPVVAVLIGTLVAHETLTTREIAGAVLVIIGVWISLSADRRATVTPSTSTSLSTSSVEGQL